MTVAAGAAVAFPQDGPTSGAAVRTGASTFNLPVIGSYYVSFQVSATEPGQLMIRLSNVELANSVVGRATGTTQLVGTSIITTTAVNTVLEIINPSGNTPALTITPSAGGTHAVSAHLVIFKL